MIVRMIKNSIFFFLMSLISVVSLTSCNTVSSSISTGRETIKIGDAVLVDFTCRLKDGGIVMTTDASLAKDENQEKAGIFIPMTEYAPVPIIAGSGKTGPDYGNLKAFENELIEDLSLVVVGMADGARGIFELTAQENKGLAGEERFLKLTRIRRQAKRATISPSAFKKSQGRDPVPGDIITSEELSGVSMTVVSVTDKEVEVNISVKEGTRIDTQLGKGTMRDAGDYYETVIDVYEGKLIRSGVIVGRVTAIEGDMFTIDYGHPFGGETLVCEVTARKDRSGNEDQKKQ